MTLTKALGGGGGGGGSGTLTTVKDEGSTLSTAVTSIDFVGAGVTATGTTAVTVTVPGGSGTGRFWDVSAIPTDASVQTARTLDFADGATSLTGFTWVNQGTATAAIQRQRLVMNSQSNGGISNSRRVYYPPSTYQIPGSTPWCVQVPVSLYGSQPYNAAGVYIKNTTSGKGLAFNLHHRDDVGKVLCWGVARFNSESSISADVDKHASDGTAVLAVTFDGTTFKFWISRDGRDWPLDPATSDAAASFIGAGGTYVFGFMVDSISATRNAGAFNNSVILNQATPVPHGQFV